MDFKKAAPKERGGFPSYIRVSGGRDFIITGRLRSPFQTPRSNKAKKRLVLKNAGLRKKGEALQGSWREGRYIALLHLKAEFVNLQERSASFQQLELRLMKKGGVGISKGKKVLSFSTRKGSLAPQRRRTIVEYRGSMGVRRRDASIKEIICYLKRLVLRKEVVCDWGGGPVGSGRKRKKEAYLLLHYLLTSDRGLRREGLTLGKKKVMP